MYIALLVVLFGGSVAGIFLVTQKREFSNDEKMKYLVAIGFFIGIIGSFNELFKYQPVISGVGEVVNEEIKFYEGDQLQIRQKFELKEYSKSSELVFQQLIEDDSNINQMFQLNNQYYQRFYLIYGNSNSGLTYNIKNFCKKIQNEFRVPFLFKTISSQIREDMSKRQILDTLGIEDFDILIETIKSLNQQYKIPLLVIDNIEYAFDSETGYFFLSDILYTLASKTKLHVFLLTTSVQVTSFKDQNAFMSQNIQLKYFSLFKEPSSVFEYLKELSLDQQIEQVEVEECFNQMEFTFEDIYNIKQKKLSVKDFFQQVKSDELSLNINQDILLNLIELQCKKYDRIQECQNNAVSYNKFKSITKMQEKEQNDMFLVQNGSIKFSTKKKFLQALFYYIKVRNIKIQEL